MAGSVTAARTPRWCCGEPVQEVLRTAVHLGITLGAGTTDFSLLAAQPLRYSAVSGARARPVRAEGVIAAPANRGRASWNRNKSG